MADSILPWPTVVRTDGDILEPDAVEAVFAARRPDVIRSLVRFGVDAADAEDITHDVFLGMLDRRRGRVPERVYAWLLACARNLAINRFRRRRREIPVVEAVWQAWARTLADPRADVERRAAGRDRARRLRRAIAALTPPQRQCLLLRSHGVTFREIGETLDVPQRRAVYLTNIAIARIQASLDETR